MTTLRTIATEAVARGYTLEAEYDCETDYEGTNVNKFMEAMSACDEMRAVFYENGVCVGWLYYSMGLDTDERIFDYGVGSDFLQEMLG